MSKLILAIMLTIINNSFAVTPSQEEIRSLYQKAAKEKVFCEQLIAITGSFDEQNNRLMAGYKACGMMIMSRYIFNPFSKLSNFLKGKELLEKCISKDPSNIELRFLRFTIQAEAPAFLGYNGQLATDKIFLLNAYKTSTDMELKQFITAFMLTSPLLTTKEKLTLD